MKKTTVANEKFKEIEKKLLKKGPKEKLAYLEGFAEGMKFAQDVYREDK